MLLYLRVRPGWRRSGPFLPDAFLLGLLFYATGASWLIAFEPAADLDVIASMAWTALASGAAGAVLYCIFARGLNDEAFLDSLRNLRAGPLERAAILTGIAVSSLICILFVYVIVKSDVIAALLGIGSIATDIDLLRARVTIASGSETYLAPGYFKQFRDILLPILLASVVLLDRRNIRKTAFWCCALLALAAMLMSGQRLVVVVFLLALGLSSHYAFRAMQRPDAPRRPRIPLLPFAVVIGGYGLLTLLLGRIEGDAPIAQTALNVLTNFLDRVFLAAPRENAISYPVWSQLGPSFGASWWYDLQGVLPGVDENLSNVLHMATGGSAAGNSPLGLAPDVWLAWGWPGLLLVPIVISVAAGILDLACAMRHSPILAALRVYLFLILPVCYSPFIFVLNGGAVAIALLVLVTVLRPLPGAHPDTNSPARERRLGHA